MGGTVFFIMLPAFCACLVLVGIHSYLGIHVIKRKVIFVDLALAQIAAMGTTIAFLFGIPPSTPQAYWFSLVLTAIGALIFSLCRVRSDKVPQEAVIGLVYAISAAIGIIIIDKAPQGASHLKHILIGSILWVKWETIIKAAIVYFLVGVFHYIFRAKFILISEQPALAWESGISVRFWDFLFYLSFGVVITHSVGTAGVLLVFVFLIAPAIMAIMVTDKWSYQLLIGWSMGFVVSVIGMGIAYQADLSAGPTVITVYGAVLLIMVTIYYHLQAQSLSRAFLKTAGVICLFAMLLLGIFFMGKYLKFNVSHNKIEIHNHEVNDEIQKIQEFDETDLADYLTWQMDVEKLKQLFSNTDDPGIQTIIIQRILTLSPRDGAKVILQFIKTDPPEYFLQDLFTNIQSLNETELRLNTDKSLKDPINQQRIYEWVKKFK